MQIQIIEDPNIERTEIRVICKKKTPELYDAVSELGVLADTFVGRRDDGIHFVSLPDILYFETVDDSIFFYTYDQIYQTGLRLYKYRRNACQNVVPTDIEIGNNQSS